MARGGDLKEQAGGRETLRAEEARGARDARGQQLYRTCKEGGRERARARGRERGRERERVGGKGGRRRPRGAGAADLRLEAAAARMPPEVRHKLRGIFVFKTPRMQCADIHTPSE